MRSFIDNAGVPIHYEIEGNGPPLVLQHGATDSLQTWYERGYVGALKLRNRLILIDARGHGNSGKPHDPEAYATELMVQDVIAVLDHLGIATTRYFGFSMGALIGFGMAQDAPKRVQAFILGGAPPIAGGSAYGGPDVDDERRSYDKLIRITVGSGYDAQRTSMDLPIARDIVHAVQSTSREPVVLIVSAAGSLPLILFERQLGTGW